MSIEPWSGSFPERSNKKAEVEVRKYLLSAGVKETKDAIDSWSLGNVLRHSYDEELNNMDYMLGRASRSIAPAAARDLAARKLELQSDMNNARIRRQYGA